MDIAGFVRFERINHQIGGTVGREFVPRLSKSLDAGKPELRNFSANASVREGSLPTTKTRDSFRIRAIACAS